MSSEIPAGDPATRRRICEAALRLIEDSGGVEVTLARVAKAARVSRQALYLHFADRAALFLAVVEFADEQRGLPERLRSIESQPSGREALGALIALHAEANPEIWPLARLLDSIRRQDPAAEQAWQNRLAHRLEGCRSLVERLRLEGELREPLDPEVAADLLWSITSLATWEQLVLERGWTAGAYRERIEAVVERLLLRGHAVRP